MRYPGPAGTLGRGAGGAQGRGRRHPGRRGRDHLSRAEPDAPTFTFGTINQTYILIGDLDSNPGYVFISIVNKEGDEQFFIQTTPTFTFPTFIIGDGDRNIFIIPGDVTERWIVGIGVEITTNIYPITITPGKVEITTTFIINPGANPGFPTVYIDDKDVTIWIITFLIVSEDGKPLIELDDKKLIVLVPVDFDQGIIVQPGDSGGGIIVRPTPGGEPQDLIVVEDQLGNIIPIVDQDGDLVLSGGVDGAQTQVTAVSCNAGALSVTTKQFTYEKGRLMSVV